MFVRNNTTCPSCGNCNTFDLSAVETNDFPEWKMHFECISCSVSFSVLLETDTLCCLFDAVISRHLDFVFEDSNVKQSWLETHLSHSSWKEKFHSHLNFARSFISKYLVKNRVNFAFTGDELLGNFVNYFTSKPDRKRRFRASHLIRTVGL